MTVARGAESGESIPETVEIIPIEIVLIVSLFLLQLVPALTRATWWRVKRVEAYSESSWRHFRFLPHDAPFAVTTETPLDLRRCDLYPVRIDLPPRKLLHEDMPLNTEIVMCFTPVEGQPDTYLHAGFVPAETVKTAAIAEGTAFTVQIDDDTEVKGVFYTVPERKE